MWGARTRTTICSLGRLLGWELCSSDGRGEGQGRSQVPATRRAASSRKCQQDPGQQMETLRKKLYFHLVYLEPLNGGFLLTLERFCSQSFGTKPRSSWQPPSSFSLLFKKKKKKKKFLNLKLFLFEERMQRPSRPSQSRNKTPVCLL